jgi:hypothetical protein
VQQGTVQAPSFSRVQDDPRVAGLAGSRTRRRVGAPQNPVIAWQVRPTAATAFVPVWICSTDPAHVWNAPLASRSSGAECPECTEHGKSRVELDHHAAAVAVFGAAR